VTLRLDRNVMHVLDYNRVLLATLPCPIPAAEFGRLQGAHPAGLPPLAAGCRPGDRGADCLEGRHVHGLPGSW
jgi:hypothetical protein